MEPRTVGLRPVAGNADHENASGVVPVSAPIHVVVWNIENFSRTHPGKKGARYGIADRIELVLTTFYAAKPDIVILLEVGKSTVIEDLDLLGIFYDIHLTEQVGENHSGERYAVLFKKDSPASGAAQVRLAKRAEGSDAWATYPSGPRCPVEIELATAGGSVFIYGIHAPFKDGDARADVMRAIAAHCADNPRPCVVCGDFNYKGNAQQQLNADLGLTHVGPRDHEGVPAPTSLTHTGKGSQPYDQVRANGAALPLVRNVEVIDANTALPVKSDRELAAVSLALRTLWTAHRTVAGVLAPARQGRRSGSAQAQPTGPEWIGRPFKAAEPLKVVPEDFDYRVDPDDIHWPAHLAERLHEELDACKGVLVKIAALAEQVEKEWSWVNRQRSAERAAALLTQSKTLVDRACGVIRTYRTEEDPLGGDIFREALSDHLPIRFTIALRDVPPCEDMEAEEDVEMEEAEAVPEADEHEAQAAPEDPDEVGIQEVAHDPEGGGADESAPKRRRRY